MGVVKNLKESKDKGWYKTGSKGLLVQSTPKSPKDLLGRSCAGGIITNLDSQKIKKMGRGAIVNEFVEGASISGGGVLGFPLLGVGFNVVKPIVQSTSPVYGSIGYEAVVGSAGIDFDLGITEGMKK